MCGIGALLRGSQNDIISDSTVDELVTALGHRGPDHVNIVRNAGAVFVGAVLHIQGEEIAQQPMIGDIGGDLFLWNGEVFGGSLQIDEGVSDTSVVMNCLSALQLSGEIDALQSSQMIMDILLQIQGPYAFIFYSAVQQRLYYGRDPFGRRSLVTGNSVDETILSISSCCFFNSSEFIWNEVPISGIYSIPIKDNTPITMDERFCLNWPATCLRLNRPFQDFSALNSHTADTMQLSSKFLSLVHNSLHKRIVRLSPSFLSQQVLVPSSQRCFVGVLFSGGIDSLLLAAMLHVALGSSNSSPIELINIAFDFRDAQGKPSAAPDRLAGIAGMFALKRLFPDRDWRFVEVDVTQAEREAAESQIKGLIKPLVTHMDLNIGTAFWFASRGQGQLRQYDATAEDILYQQTNEEYRPLLRIGEEGALRGVGRSAAAVEPVAEGEDPNIAILDEIQGDEISDLQDANSPDIEIEKKAPHWCCKPKCKRPTKRTCPGRLCGRCCEEKMNEDSTYKCKTHLKGRAKREGCATITAPTGDQEEDCGTTFDYHILPVQFAEPYRAQCKALLVGIGADEQLAGYGRHRTVFQHGGYEALQQELNKDLTRLWQRNLGRDDRCIADHGREAWFPYLDEELVSFIQSQPLSYLTNLTLPQGVGDKQILRQAAANLGLEKSAQLVKRAIQFGSLASKQTSVSYFGSRRKGKGTSTI